MENAEKRVMRAVSWMITICFLLAMPPAVMAQPDVEKHPACPYCGMDRAKFAHSRMLVNYEGGSAVGTCSLHCAVIDQALKIDLIPAQVLVGDFGSKKLIDAERAYWVMGGDKMGVMTTRAKWAFENLQDANAYIQAHGGKLVTYEAAVEGAFEDMYKDIQMIRKKRQMKRQKKAE